MKRVFLVAPGEPISLHGELQANPTVLRAAAVALARFAVNAPTGRTVGDPVHEWVTEGRRKQYEDALAAGAEWAVKMAPHGGYSSCGDEAQWLLMCLGVRDERYVNRSGDGGVHPWVSGVNIARLCALPAYVKASAGQAPRPGDITHVTNADHVAVSESFRPDLGSASSCDYGQPHAAYRERAVVQRGATWIVGGRVLAGWVDIELLRFEESALVPDDFELGTVDDNPYPEDLSIPAGVP